MKTAICISGQPRNAQEGFNFIKASILDNNDCDVFLHAWIDPSKVGQRYHFAFSDLVLPDTDKLLLDLYNPKGSKFEVQKEFLTEGFNYAGFGDTTPHYMIFTCQSMFYGIHQADMLRRLYETENNIKYDCVVRIRYDLALKTPFVFSDYDLSCVYFRNDCSHEPGCMNDHFAFSNRENMKQYCDTYLHLNEIKDECPFVPEILLGRSIKRCKIPVNPIHLDSCCVRDLPH